MQIISIFDNIKKFKAEDAKDISIDLFLDFIRDGKWQDLVLPARAKLAQTTDKKLRSDIKGALPYVTISGKFKDRSIAGLTDHSGFICIDIDDKNPQEIKEILSTDKYCYSCFASLSGLGGAMLVKIDPAKHQEAFDGLQEYLFNTYKIVIDSSCRDVSRARFVSYDPDIYINNKASKFTQYVKKKVPEKIEKIIYAPGDFEDLINEVVKRQVNICEAYSEWLRCGFALAHKFGEEGRRYYHAISQFSAKYDKESADKQYDNCIRGRNSGTTISTLYYYVKQAGIPLYSKQTQLIAASASVAQRGGRTKEDTIKGLQQFEGISPADSTDIVNQVFDNKIIIQSDESVVSEIEQWLRHNYQLRRNAITRYIENNAKPLQQKDFNSIYIAAKKIFEKLPYELLDKIINSDFTPDYNPIIEYYNNNIDLDNPGVIGDLWNTITTDNPAFLRYFGTKWLVGIIASAHGQHSRLMLVLVSELQNIGKTEFFRRLFPKDLQPYYAESKLDAGKDDDILMTQKLLIMDDEMGGKSKKDEKRTKEMLSKQTFSLREPYGRNNVDLQRLAVLCGTSNDKRLISDPTGNTRIVPAQTNAFNHAAYNAINKDELIMAAYHLYKNGFKWQLTKEDIATLEAHTDWAQSLSGEYELISKYYQPGAPGGCELMTATDIQVDLYQKTGLKLSSVKIGQELSRLDFVCDQKRINGKRHASQVYLVVKIDPTNKLYTPAPEQNNRNNDAPVEKVDDDLQF